MRATRRLAAAAGEHHAPADAAPAAISGGSLPVPEVLPAAVTSRPVLAAAPIASNGGETCGGVTDPPVRL